MQGDEKDLSTSEESENHSGMDKYLWLGFPLVVVIWFLYGFYQGELQADSSFDRLNTLFSGLAFWGVIWAIVLQKRELGFQRKELQLTRREVRGQKEQLQAQNVTLKQQRFENTFFSLLDLFASMVDSMNVPQPSAPEMKGREAFILFAHDYERSFNGAELRTNTDMKERSKQAFAAFYSYRQIYIDHYFRTLYHIIRFVDSSEVENKQLYVDLLRAQLSSSEVKLILYNCLSDMGKERFKPLVDKYGLLKNLRKEILSNPGLFDLYEESSSR
jgi:hypothetical protein